MGAAKVTVVFFSIMVMCSAWPISSLLGNGVKPSGAKKLVAQLDAFNDTFKIMASQLSDLEIRKVDKSSFESLRNEIKDFKSEIRELEGELRILEKDTEEIRVRLGNHLIAAAPILPPCTGTKLHFSGKPVTASLGEAPNGVVCLGNSANPSSSRNFLVFQKNDSYLHFLGTQSLNNDFIDFTVHVNWIVAVNYTCSALSGCGALPAQLRSSIFNSPTSYCSKSNPTGNVYLSCASTATFVDNDGAILTNQLAHIETLWY